MVTIQAIATFPAMPQRTAEASRAAPARVVRQLTDDERRLLRASAAHYAEKAQRYAAELRLI